MSITAECIECVIEHGMIKLPKSLRLPDGSKVLVKIESMRNTTQRKKIARELAGCWSNDVTINKVFSEIIDERGSYFGREIAKL